MVRAFRHKSMAASYRLSLQGPAPSRPAHRRLRIHSANALRNSVSASAGSLRDDPIAQCACDNAGSYCRARRNSLIAARSASDLAEQAQDRNAPLPSGVQTQSLFESRDCTVEISLLGEPDSYSVIRLWREACRPATGPPKPAVCRYSGVALARMAPSPSRNSTTADK